MTENLSPDGGDATERAIAAGDAEAERVGVDWERVADSLLSAHPDLAPDGEADDDSPALGLDIELLLPILRALPDGAGTDAFLAALDRSGSSPDPPPG